MAQPLEKIKDKIKKRVENGYAYRGTSVYDTTNKDIEKLGSISDKYGFPVEWLANLINHETAGTWNPSIKNSIGATGLIQFMPSTAIGLGTTTDKLRQMSFSEQLEYVDQYLKQALKNKKILNDEGKVPNSFAQSDLFMLIFYPKSVGNPNFVFPNSVQRANGVATPMEYTQKALKNGFFDLNEAPFTIQEYLNKYKNVTSSFTKQNKKWWVAPSLIVIFGSIVVATIWIIKKNK